MNAAVSEWDRNTQTEKTSHCCYGETTILISGAGATHSTREADVEAISSFKGAMAWGVDEPPVAWLFAASSIL